ncbi:MAG: NlpC/P60 family protein [Candidatus Ornithomonoglobus sp.]
MAMLSSLTKTVKNVFDPYTYNNSASSAAEQYRQRVASAAQPQEDYNPFVNRRTGKLLNPAISRSTYQKMIDNGTNEKVKQYIQDATGLKPTASDMTAQNSETGTYAATDTDYFSFNGNADENNLYKLDVKTELPKLSTNQISVIISKYFGKSTVISPSDAAGIYNAQQQSGMSALAILGIGALESGYGTSSIAKQKNNLWGWNATNSNPGGNATSFSQIGTGALEYANKYLSTYYNNYGAKSIYDAGTGNNPAGKGYAYNNDGSISSTWASAINSIMKNFYQTAKSVAASQQTAVRGTTAGTIGGNKVVLIAKQFLGTPYVWGGTTPKGFDCSGLMQYAYKQMGINIPRVSQDQFKSGTAVDKSQLRAGDLVFFKGSSGTASDPGHVGMYIGNGQYIQAPQTGDVVKISDLSARSDYVGARRYLN